MRVIATTKRSVVARHACHKAVAALEGLGGLRMSAHLSHAGRGSTVDAASGGA